MRLINRWSIRLALIGVALGFLQSYKVLTLPHFMIGFGIPFAIVLAAIGVLIDFSLAKKNGTGGGVDERPTDEQVVNPPWSARSGYRHGAAFSCGW